ncbi:LysR substrate-binding domain-containing protein [Thalassospira sp. MCCC 1A01428]|uniref:LysR substrate-binding domain-containing protein n=1 Tax=Thalassospira sp. MCCC 1A01428 TaxID=1470575 RepID=UPI00143D67DD|nr:LysR substrate-binding domain-containing protein [Thalassospira sp. MCCC 1A01428]
MVSRLPSIACLRAAEAVARHRSFSRAAIELNLTQTAISHQIRKLEELLGTGLFLRTGRIISLTPQGEDYLADIRPLVVGISHATDRLASGKRDNVLRIGAPGTFLLKCLAPRIGEFIALHPDIDVRMLTLDPYRVSDRDGTGDFKDLSLIVRYGLGTFPGHDAYKISTERIFPVCSPALIGNRQPPLDPAELSRHRVIRTTTPLLLRDDWPLWLETAGVPGLGFDNEITCDLLYSCFELAIHGVGMVMGRTPLIDADIAAGRLIAPFSQSLLSASGYFLTAPYGSRANEPVRLFRDWFMGTFASEDPYFNSSATPVSSDTSDDGLR